MEGVRRRAYSLLARIGWGCTVQVMPRNRSPTGIEMLTDQGRTAMSIARG